MCRRVSCRDCGKPTFRGCGDHVEEVLGDVPPPERCRCREQARLDALTGLSAATADAA